MQNRADFEPKERKACSFERIYFFERNDEEIYRERKALGFNLRSRVLKNHWFWPQKYHFLLYPNTSEVAFLIWSSEGMQMYLEQNKSGTDS